jgi:hypothetical protein
LAAGKVVEHLIAQEAEPCWPDPVQGAELAPRVPPLRGKARKPVDLLSIERR